MTIIAKLPQATKVTIYSLGAFLGLIHLILGVIAATPMLNQEYHREMRSNYNAFARSLTFLHDFVDTGKLALTLRYSMSVCQVLFGALLVENGHFTSSPKLANFAMLAADLIFLFLQLIVGSSYQRIAPTIVFSILLVGRLLIIEQSTKRVKVGVRTRNAGKPKTSTPKKNKNE